jgi:hypothetical protein
VCAASDELLHGCGSAHNNLQLDLAAVDPAGSGLLWSNTSAPMVGYGFQVSAVTNHFSTVKTSLGEVS